MVTNQAVGAGRHMVGWLLFTQFFCFLHYTHWGAVQGWQLSECLSYCASCSVNLGDLSWVFVSFLLWSVKICWVWERHGPWNQKLIKGLRESVQQSTNSWLNYSSRWLIYCHILLKASVGCKWRSMCSGAPSGAGPSYFYEVKQIAQSLESRFTHV